MLAGCAGEGTDGIFTTGALANNTQTAAAPEPRIDPACVSLVSRIEALRKEGIADKIEKAAAKKYKMTQADLGKADQLTKANAEFQLRCSTVAPSRQHRPDARGSAAREARRLRSGRPASHRRTERSAGPGTRAAFEQAARLTVADRCRCA